MEIQLSQILQQLNFLYFRLTCAKITQINYYLN